MVYNACMYRSWQVSILRHCLLLSEETISKDPEKLGLELSGRLLPYAAEYQVMQDLILACDNDAPNTLPVVPVMQVQVVPSRT